MQLNPNILITENRLDIIFKLIYLELKEKSPNYAQELYKQHIDAFTLGKFQEPCNESKKNLTDFLRIFSEIEKSIKTVVVMIKRIEAITIPLTTGFVFSDEITTIEKIVMSAKAVASLRELNKGICAKETNKTSNSTVIGIGITQVLGVDFFTYKTSNNNTSAAATRSSNENLS
jgi:hypothetical protein